MEKYNDVVLRKPKWYHFDKNVMKRLKGIYPEKTGNHNTSFYCIVCGHDTPFDLRHPCCDNHKIEQEGGYCHICGKVEKTSVREPRCEDCKPMCEYLEARWNSENLKK